MRYIGHLEPHRRQQIADAEYKAILGGHPKFISAQNEYSLLARGVEAEVLPAVNHYGPRIPPVLPAFITAHPAVSSAAAARPCGYAVSWRSART